MVGDTEEEAEVLAISRFAWGPGGCLGIGDEKPVPGDADAWFISECTCWISFLLLASAGELSGHGSCRLKELLNGFGKVRFLQFLKPDASSEPPKKKAKTEEAKAEVDEAALLLGDFEKCQSKLEALRAQQPEVGRASVEVAGGFYSIGPILLVVVEDPSATAKRQWAHQQHPPARTKHAKKSIDFGKAILEAAGEGREYIEKPPEEPLPSFFQEMLMSFVPTKKQFLVLCCPSKTGR
ncbi:hypothetical protein AK812_SmicGene30890 [Symbiodinium microadriaticum]|uniref:Uncharacterized protein n=1 Tax=Symbiodinium microadriaticum TaxID=2951 RepID=A0A1Q9CY64_SYMMI|nr:hypothetical protein AK812_SmicGene30890 [Symbiodinium microadriaticum]